MIFKPIITAPEWTGNCLAEDRDDGKTWLSITVYKSSSMVRTTIKTETENITGEWETTNFDRIILFFVALNLYDAREYDPQVMEDRRERHRK